MTFPPPAPTGALQGAHRAPSAAIVIIGNEILSGKTKDANTPWIAARLKERGIRLHEVRIVADTQAAIAGAVNALRAAYDFVFTTGGIGPTHDDITAESISAAFGRPHTVHPEAQARMAADYAARGIDFNAARLRMATMPEGSELLQPEHSSAPGFKTGNVFVMAGIPSVMQDMWTAAEKHLPRAAEITSTNVTCRIKEGELAQDLSDIQNLYPEVDIGSYPAADIDGGFTVTLVLSSANAPQLADATAAVHDMVKRLQG